MLFWSRPWKWFHFIVCMHQKLKHTGTWLNAESNYKTLPLLCNLDGDRMSAQSSTARVSSWLTVQFLSGNKHIPNTKQEKLAKCKDVCILDLDCILGRVFCSKFCLDTGPARIYILVIALQRSIPSIECIFDLQKRFRFFFIWWCMVQIKGTFLSMWMINVISHIHFHIHIHIWFPEEEGNKIMKGLVSSLTGSSNTTLLNIQS